jgi:hypothetical protein
MQFSERGQSFQNNFPRGQLLHDELISFFSKQDIYTIICGLFDKIIEKVRKAFRIDEIDANSMRMSFFLLICPRQVHEPQLK